MTTIGRKRGKACPVWSVNIFDTKRVDRISNLIKLLNCLFLPSLPTLRSSINLHTIFGRNCSFQIPSSMGLILDCCICLLNDGVIVCFQFRLRQTSWARNWSRLSSCCPVRAKIPLCNTALLLNDPQSLSQDMNMSFFPHWTPSLLEDLPPGGMCSCGSSTLPTPAPDVWSNTCLFRANRQTLTELGCATQLNSETKSNNAGTTRIIWMSK